MAEQIPFSVVENVLSSLGSSVVQKIGTMYGVRKELTKLEETMGTLKAVLLDAEDQLEKSHAVKDWVKRLKGVVYDVDDLLDDFATYRLLRGGLVRQVSHFFSSSNQVAFHFQMSGRVDDIKEALDEIKKDIFLLNAIPRSTIHPRAKNIGRETHSSPSTSNLDQRNAKKEEIVKLLVSPDKENVFIVAIVGIGGLGKTTLAQLVFNNETVKKHFEYKKWVCVSDDSGDGFGENALIKMITKSKNDEVDRSSQSPSLDDLKNKLKEEISQKKYLLVLDDVWSNESEKWEKVRTLLEVGAEGSKIVVTTRNTEVQFMGNNTSRIKLEGLGEPESWKLFSDITFGGQENTVSPEIIKVGKEIVNMCNGVPLIINTLGRTLMQFKSDLSKWLSVRKNENLLSLPYGNDNVLQVLKLSYDNLPTHLKQCFTYCALFPKDYEIEKKLLVQLWIAQGYIQSTNGNEQLEDIGDQYFKELLSSSLLEEVEKDAFNSTLSCKMHDLVRDLAQSIVGSEVLILRSDVNNITEEARHVSLLEEVNPMNNALKGKPIRTFLNHCEDSFEANTIVNSFLPSFMCLRALSLNNLNVKKVPKCLGKLSHLRYIDLSYNDFKILPNSIPRLKNLRTLKLIGCWNLNRIPENIGELINLRHLENDGCYGLTHMPRGIGKLTSLQSLPWFVVGNDIGGLRNHKVGSLSELKSLNQLRGELCIRNLQNVRDLIRVSKEEILKGKRHLQSLRLEWERSDQVGRDGGDKLVMEGLQPNSNLRELFIGGYGGRWFPSWMINDGLGSLLPNLIKIEIWGCSRCQILPPFSQLSSLRSLRLHDMKEVEELKEGSSAAPFFPSLESFRLSHMPKLKELWRMDLLAEQGPSFSHLSKLYISGCSDLASLHSSPLSRLEIYACPNLTSLGLPSSPYLSELEISKCHNLTSLELHSSPRLSKLEISKCRKLTSLELHSSPSLSQLEINDCPNLTSLKLHSSPSLSQLEINDCPNLTSLELHSSPSLSQLEINDCPNLTSLELHSSPSLSQLEIRECHNLTSLELHSSPCLSKLEIRECRTLTSLKLHSSPSLSQLEINDCPNLTSLELYSSPSLSQLEINDCPNLTSLELHSSPSLSQLEINDCPNLTSLELHSSLSLSQLHIRKCPNLASFKVASLPSLVKLYLFTVRYDVIWQILFVHASSSLKSLSIRNIDDMISLRKELLQHVSGLATLRIHDCPKLYSLELHSSPSLSQLEIYDCPNLTSLELHSSPSLSQLEIHDCPNLTYLELHSSPYLSQLDISKCPNLTSLKLHLSPSLSQLEINDCPNLTSLELHSSPSLTQLDISKCPNLASFKVASLPSLEKLYLFTVRYDVIQQIMFVYASSLKSVSIRNIDDMISLPKELLQHVSGLATLKIRDCPQLCFLELLSSHWLSKLKIINCPNLASFNVASLPRLEELSLRGVRTEVLRQLMFVLASSSLKSLCIREIDGIISLPEEPLQYVSTLETLCIVKCSGLATLLHWMGSLSSLTYLTIYDCTELTSLPEEIYSLKKLQKFYFCDYPDLEERYIKETGEGRAKIAHIPHIRFQADYILYNQLLRDF